MSKERETANLVSSQTGIAVTISGDPVVLGVGNTETVSIFGSGSVGINTTSIANGNHLSVWARQGEGHGRISIHGDGTNSGAILSFYEKGTEGWSIEGSYVNGPLFIRDEYNDTLPLSIQHITRKVCIGGSSFETDYGGLTILQDSNDDSLTNALTLYRYRSGGALTDGSGASIKWKWQDNDNGPFDYGELTASQDQGGDDNDSAMLFKTMTAGTLRQRMSIKSSSSFDSDYIEFGEGSSQGRISVGVVTTNVSGADGVISIARDGSYATELRIRAQESGGTLSTCVTVRGKDKDVVIGPYNQGAANPSSRGPIRLRYDVDTFDDASYKTGDLVVNMSAGTSFQMMMTRISGSNYGTLNLDSAGEGIYFRTYSGGYSYRHQFTKGGYAYNSTGTWGTISDQRLKQDITNAQNQWDDIKALRFVNYRLISDVEHEVGIGTTEGYTAPTMLGLIAQEVEEISPGLVDETYDSNIKVGVGTTFVHSPTKTVKTSVLTMKAVKALQEAMVKIEQLQAEVLELRQHVGIAST